MNNNYCVIMGGGIGTRFWPFSRETRPKQFLDFFGMGKSLLQMTVDRFARLIPIENIYIVTNENYADLIKEQLPLLKDNQILLEPDRRNTAPCIAYASYHIKSKNPHANIVVSPSDHLILKEDKFIQDVAKGLEFVKNNKTLVTLGIIPSRPDVNYGYIQSSEAKMGEFSKVKTFTEKPDIELANIFLESGEFFWNSGMFFWNVETIIEAIRKYLPAIAERFDNQIHLLGTAEEKTFIEENYPYFQNISIDFGVMEKADNVCMLCVDFGWADIGTWGSIFDIAKDESNSAVLNKKALLYEAENNIIVLDNKDKLAVVQGLSNYIIVESGNVLLICRKEDESKIKHYMADVQRKFGKQYI